MLKTCFNTKTPLKTGIRGWSMESWIVKIYESCKVSESTPIHSQMITPTAKMMKQTRHFKAPKISSYFGSYTASEYKSDVRYIQPCCSAAIPDLIVLTPSTLSATL
jgi:hypothetical protein